MVIGQAGLKHPAGKMKDNGNWIFLVLGDLLKHLAILSLQENKKCICLCVRLCRGSRLLLFRASDLLSAFSPLPITEKVN